jgi:hypothetical protein
VRLPAGGVAVMLLIQDSVRKAPVRDDVAAALDHYVGSLPDACDTGTLHRSLKSELQ